MVLRARLDLTDDGGSAWVLDDQTRISRALTLGSSIEKVPYAAVLG
jgi:hypothetical protein